MEWQYVSSKSNALVVRLAKLKDKKYRKAEGLFRFDGIKLFCEAAKNGAPISYVLVCESASDEIKRIAEESGVNAAFYILSENAFEKLTDELSPEGIITVCSELKNIEKIDDCSSLASRVSKKRVLLLESVRDAGNLGTVIRTAKAFGIDMLIISSDCADLYNPKTVRGAMGALFSQSIAVTDNMSECISALRKNGGRVFAAALRPDAKKLGSFELELGDAIVIGNEGHGLSKDVIDACDECVYIPMQEGSESLNASIAASVCMWELYKIK